MTVLRMLVVLAVLVSSGCRTTDEPVEGSFVPGCTAFAGDRISLREGQYSWNKFTDERRLGATGEPVDPYPDFPKVGDYEVDGNAVRLLDNAGGVLGTWYVHLREEQILLLSQAQEEAWSADGGFPDCPLVLER
ncbi:MAG: hypothetical protein AAGA61_07190 [Pseudomonadota bacterium]